MYDLFKDSLVDKEAQTEKSVGASNRVEKANRDTNNFFGTEATTPQKSEQSLGGALLDAGVSSVKALNPLRIFGQGDNRSYSETFTEGAETVKEAGGMFSSIWNAGKTFVENKFMNKSTEQGINDLSKFQDYNNIIDMAVKAGNMDIALEYSDKLKTENIVDNDKFKIFQESILNQKERVDYRQLIKEDLIKSIESRLSENTDPYIQEVLYKGADEIGKQFNQIYNNIEESFNNESFNKDIFRKKLNVAKEQQIKFFEAYSDNLIKTNGNDSKAYKLTLEDATNKDIARSLGNLYLDVEAASSNAAIRHYANKISDGGNFIENIPSSLLIAGNLISRVTGTIGRGLEKAKQKGLGMYDITEELGNLNVYRETDNVLTKAVKGTKWATFEVIDAVPFFLPELVSMLIGDKGVTKIPRLKKTIDNMSNAAAYKASVFGYENAMDLLKYDMIGRGMLGRGATGQDLAEDLMIGVPINGIISMLSSPAKKYSDQYLNTILKGKSVVDFKINDDVMDLLAKGKKEEAIILASKNTADTNYISKPLVKYKEDEVEGFRKEIGDFINKLNTGDPDSKLIAKESISAHFQKRTTDEIENSMGVKKEILEDVKRGSATGGQNIKDKVNINIIADNIKNNQILLSDIETKINNISKDSINNFISNEDFDLAKEIAFSLIGGKKELSDYINNIPDESLFDIKNTVSIIIDKVAKYNIAAKDLIPIGGMYGKYIRKTKNEFVDLTTGQSVSIKEFNKDNDNLLKNNIDSIKTKLEDLLDIFNSKTRTIDISDTLNITSFINLEGVIKQGVAKTQLSKTLNLLGLKLNNGRIDTTLTDVKRIINTLGSIKSLNNAASIIGDKIILNKNTYGLFKLLNLESSYNNFEKLFFVSGKKNPEQYITGKSFEEFSMFGMFKENKDGKYELIVNNPNRNNINEYLGKIISSDLSGIDKEKVIKEILITSNIFDGLSKGRTTKGIINEELNNIPLLKLEENKALNNKISKNINNIVDTFKDEKQLQGFLLAALKDSIFYTPAVIYELSNFSSEGQDSYIRDLLWTIAIGKTAFRTGLKMKESMKDFGEAYNEILKEINNVFGKNPTNGEIIKNQIVNNTKYTDEQLRILNTFNQSYSNIYGQRLTKPKAGEYLDVFKMDFGYDQLIKQETLFTTEKSLSELNSLKQQYVDFLNKIKNVTGVKRNEKMFTEGVILKDQFKKLIYKSNDTFLKENEEGIFKLHTIMKVYSDSQMTNVAFKKVDTLVKDTNMANALLQGALDTVAGTYKMGFKTNPALIKNFVKNDLIKKIEFKEGQRFKELSPKEAIYYGENSSIVYNSSGRLVSLNTRDGNDFIRTILNDNNIKKVFIHNDKTTHSGKESRIKIGNQNIETIGLDDLIRSGIYEENTTYLLGEKSFYTFFENKGGKIFLRNDSIPGYSNLLMEDKDKFFDFLELLKNDIKGIKIYGTDFNLYKDGKEIYVNNSGTSNFLKDLNEAQLISSDKLKVEYNYSNKDFELISNESYYNNLDYQLFLNDNIDFKLSDVNKLKANPNYKRYAYIYDENTELLKSPSITTFENIASSTYLLSPIGNKYYQAIRNISNRKNIRLNDQIDSRDLLITEQDYNQYINTLRNKSINETFFSREIENTVDIIKRELNLDDIELTTTEKILEIINKLSGTYDDSFIRNLVNYVTKDLTDPQYIRVFEDLPTVVKRYFVTPKDIMNLQILTSKLLDNIGISKQEFNMEISKMSKEISSTYLLNNKKNSEVYKFIDGLDTKSVNYKNKIKELVPTSITDNYIYGLLTVLKQEGLINNNVDIIQNIKGIDGELKNRLLNNIRGYSNTDIYTNELLDETFKKNISSIINIIDPKRARETFEDTFDGLDLLDNNSLREFEASLLDEKIGLIQQRIGDIHNQILDSYLLGDDLLYYSKGTVGLGNNILMPYNNVLLNLKDVGSEVKTKDLNTKNIIEKFEMNKNGIDKWNNLDSFTSIPTINPKEIYNFSKNNNIGFEIYNSKSQEYESFELANMFKKVSDNNFILTDEGGKIISKIIYSITNYKDPTFKKLNSGIKIFNIRNDIGDVRSVDHNNLNDSILLNILQAISYNPNTVKTIDDGISQIYRNINDGFKANLKFETRTILNKDEVMKSIDSNLVGKEFEDAVNKTIKENKIQYKVITTTSGKKLNGITDIYKSINFYNKKAQLNTYSSVFMTEDKFFKETFENFLKEPEFKKILPEEFNYNDIDFLSYNPIYAIKQNEGSFTYINSKGVEEEMDMDFIVKTGVYKEDTVSIDGLDGADFWKSNVAKKDVEEITELRLGRDYNELYEGQSISFELKGKMYKLINEDSKLKLLEAEDINPSKLIGVKEELEGPILKITNALKDSCI